LNRAEKTKQYLINRLELFKGYRDLIDSKVSFFESVRRFRENTIPFLRKTKIIKESELQKLDNLLASIDTMKSKGSNTEVYWKRVRLEYGEVQSTLNDLILSMDQTKVPFSIRLEDFLKDLFAEKSALSIILGVVVVLLLAILTGIVNFFINLILSLFK
jgi:hypothetical protein